ncbi:uncharacterized protein B0I36DRAFT_37461 [Microdochium trichocladiopsis]|uniref:Uncharacterized protein n=1 Tax=Microdochium trichocladiopsis TaxID=1682393 RepID=A0A9P9BHA3_9PEZI|nr:uncharacterized protein B0I36DRAFT_37461 [Microdochium trichocladiopsis]KAH7018284.1 hypothetical protein B0I36DRAFT_37461 [Microdochium trichocladiopsis]
MATNANLPSGAFLTTIGGKKCTAVPFAARNVTVTTSSLLTTTLVTSTTTTANLEVTASPDLSSSTSAESVKTSPAATVPIAVPSQAEPSTTSAVTTTVATQVTTTSTEAQTTAQATTQTQVISASVPPAQNPPPAQDVVAPTTAVATSAPAPPPAQPQPETTQQPVQDPALAPSPTTATTTAAIVPGVTTTNTSVAASETTVPVDDSTTTPNAAPSTDVPADTQPQPTEQQPGSDGQTTPSTTADGVVLPSTATATATTTSTSTAPLGVPVLAGPGPSEASEVVEPVTSTNELGEIVVAPTQPASPDSPGASSAPRPPVTPSISDTRPPETALPSLEGGGGGMGPQATAAVAGGVAGTVVLIGILAFLFCWRRRRRNGPRSPGSPASTERGIREKAPYVITRTSIGPTPVSEKFKASMVYKYQQASLHMVELGVRAAEAIGLRKRTDVDLDRGPSQYGPLMAGGHSRNNSGFGLPPATLVPKRDFPDWWDRLTEDEAQNWTIKPEDGGAQPSRQPADQTTDRSSIRASSNVMGANAVSNQDPPPPIPTRKGPIANDGAPAPKTGGTLQPTKAPASGRPGQPRQAAPSDHFLSNLGLNFDPADPFSDVNSMSHVSAMVMPLSAPTGTDPFSDANAIPTNPQARGPANYVQGVQHARRESRNAVMRRQQAESVYRDSAVSEESFQTRRNRVRSDPFDLDRPELRAAMPPNAADLANKAKEPAPPRQAHVRTHSSSSSKYSTHTVSEAAWSEPGPDIGPGVARKRSNGSQTSVGRAM